MSHPELTVPRQAVPWLVERARAPPRSFDWGGGRMHMASKPTYPQNSVHLGFRPLYFENVGKGKIFNLLRKKVAEM